MLRLLPLEIIHMIFQYMNVRDKFAVMLTCHDLHNTYSDHDIILREIIKELITSQKKSHLKIIQNILIDQQHKKDSLVKSIATFYPSLFEDTKDMIILTNFLKILREVKKEDQIYQRILDAYETLEQNSDITQLQTKLYSLCMYTKDTALLTIILGHTNYHVLSHSFMCELIADVVIDGKVKLLRILLSYYLIWFPEHKTALKEEFSDGLLISHENEDAILELAKHGFI